MSNPILKHLVYDYELTLYPYAPIGLLHNKGEWPDPKYQLSLVTTASTKDKNIVEWLTYHQSLGVNHIYLYCTDEDPTDLYRQILVFTLGKEPFVTFRHYRFNHSKNQIYFHFLRHYLHETLWYINLENCDFLYVHDTQTLSDFINSFIEFHAVYFNIICYNKKEITNPVDRIDIANPTIVFQNTLPDNSSCTDTKLMIRSRYCPYQYIFHNLDKPIDQHIDFPILIDHCCNVLKNDMKQYYDNFPNSALEFISSDNIPEKIITTAYIARFNNPENPYSFESKNHIVPNYTPPMLLSNYTPEKYWEKTLKKLWKHSLLPPTPQFSFLVSKNKSCRQSSAPQGKIAEELAYSLISGQMHGTTQSITLKETNPWWEIDLQSVFIIKNIRLFNGIDLNIKNMSCFLIESSEDNQNWIKRHQKITSNLFGGSDGSYYNWLHPLGFKARWLRISVPGNNKTFSLDQIQVFGMELKNFHVP